MKTMDANEIISFIQNSKKATPVKVYIKGDLANIHFGDNIKTFISGDSGVIFGEWSEIELLIHEIKIKFLISLLKTIEEIRRFHY